MCVRARVRCGVCVCNDVYVCLRVWCGVCVFVMCVRARVWCVCECVTCMYLCVRSMLKHSLQSINWTVDESAWFHHFIWRQ